MKYIISDSSITRINETEGTIQIATEGAKIEISDSADFTDVFVLSSLTPKNFSKQLYIRGYGEIINPVEVNVVNFNISEGGGVGNGEGLSAEDTEAIAQAFKAGRVDGNTVSFFVDSDTTGTPAFYFDFPEEIFLDQVGTRLVENFSWGALAYPNSVNPNLDGKTVLVLAVKGDKEVNPTVKYSFVDVEKLINIYTASDTSLTIRDYKAKVNLDADSDNLLTLTANGLMVDGSTIKPPYTPSDTSVAIANYKVKANISAAANNSLTLQNDGLHVDISGKVDKVTGKDLSTNDFTTAEKTKLAGIETGAQVNVIESVKVNGTALTPASKAVNIDISGKVDKVKNATAGNLALLASDGSLTNSTIAAEEFFKVAIPLQDGTVTYNGTEQSPCWLNYDTSKMTVSGVTSAVNAGTYTAIFTLAGGYKWLDGTTAPKSVTWTIQRAASYISISQDSAVILKSETATTVTFSFVSDAPLSAISAVSADSDVADCSISENSVIIYKVAKGETYISLLLPQTNNYNAATCNISVRILNVSDIYTTVLLSFEDDDSPDELGHDITVNYGTLNSYSSEIFKFGTRSWDNNNKKNACSIFNLTFGGQDGTIDFWFYPVSHSAQYLLFFGIVSLPDAPLCIFHYDVSRPPYTIYAESKGFWLDAMPTDNVWHHLAYVYTHSTSTIRIFLDGILKRTDTVNFNRYTSCKMYFGSSPNVGNRAAYYYMDNIRVSDGIARWTENFTPPTAEDY